MPSVARILEVALFSVFDLVPCLIISLLPFMDRLRYSKRKTNVIVLIIILIQVTVGTLSALFLSEKRNFTNLFSLAICFVALLVLVKARIGKKAFVALILANVSSFVTITAKYLELLIFSPSEYVSYSWRFSLMLLLVGGVLYSLLVVTTKEKIKVAMKKEGKISAWNYLWLIPATFYFIWYFHVYYHHVSPLDFARDLGHVIYNLVVNWGAILIYHVVLKLIIEQHNNYELRAHNSMLSIETLQYESLQKKIKEARQAKHDIRHHVTLMLGYVESGEYDKLKTYLSNYQRSMPDDSAIELCKNHAVNMLLLYFGNIAKENCIDYAVKVKIPQDVFIKEHDLSVLMGNLLENAIHACTEITQGEKKISIGASYDENQFYLTIDNTFVNEIKKDSLGVLLSTKHSGNGLGVESVKDIVKTYNGKFEQEIIDGYFCTSIMLKRGI